MIHGEDHAAGSGRFHDSQIGQFRLCRYRALEFFQGFIDPGCEANGALGSVGQNVSGGG